MARLPPLDPDALTGRQREVFDGIAQGPRGGVLGPFTALLLQPEVADRVQALGARLRFEGTLPGRLRELAVLVTAHFWGAAYEWAAHAPIARKEGVPVAVIEAIADGRQPDFDDARDAAVYRFCSEMLETHEAGDETYADVLDALGLEGVVEMTALVGYYALLAMVLKTFRIEPEGPDAKA
ncbi:MAG: carboxymuconolactone decarboxylase family protein [Proteobacteria bacterium]|nr:carboxymuconolactone decarboxylase family protein [Pseudomonadota bacterium]